jgi:hypothetical protein
MFGHKYDLVKKYFNLTAPSRSDWQGFYSVAYPGLSKSFSLIVGVKYYLYIFIF